MKSRAFQAKGNIDSAYYYSKKAFFGLPNNSMHLANFVKLAMEKKDTLLIVKAAGQLLETQSSANWQNMITAYIDIIGAGDRKLIELTERAVKLFPYNRNFLLLRKLATTKPEEIQKGLNIAREALDHFNRKEYNKSLSLYFDAIKLDPMEYSYYENAATCFYQLKDYGNSMLYSSKVIDQFNPGTGKSEYINGISKITLGDFNGGCEIIKKAIEFNYKQAEIIQNEYCKDYKK